MKHFIFIVFLGFVVGGYAQQIDAVSGATITKQEDGFFEKLKVTNVKPLTPNAKEISFEVPEKLKEKFAYKAGQYVTLRFNFLGSDVERFYSLCSSPDENALRIGVERVKGGLVSNYINDSIEIGRKIEVSPPAGQFFVEVNPKNHKTYYLFADGSCITPILSILKSVLRNEKHSSVQLMYANLNQTTIMFGEELKRLQKKYKKRFVLEHYLSQPTLDKNGEGLKFIEGEINEKTIQSFVGKHSSGAQDAEYYICAPQETKANIVHSLHNIGVPEGKIFK